MVASLSRQVYVGVAWLFLILLPVQFFFAAAGSFSNLTFAPHMWLGLIIHSLSAVLIVAALVGRLPRRALEWGILLFVLVGLQVVLSRLGFPRSTISAEPQFVRDLIASIMQPIHDAMQSSAGWVASLHGVNALAIVAAAFLTVRYARSHLRETRAQGAPADT
jgi:Family of unknown function (DUF6220)